MRATPPRPPASLMLWQPVHSGATFLTQFLRLRIANDMLSDDKEKGGGTKALRDALRGGEALEMAGYELAPALADAIESLDAAALLATGCPVHWFEAVPADGRPLSPAARQSDRRLASRRRRRCTSTWLPARRSGPPRK